LLIIGKYFKPFELIERIEPFEPFLGWVGDGGFLPIFNHFSTVSEIYSTILHFIFNFHNHLHNYLFVWQ